MIIGGIYTIIFFFCLFTIFFIVFIWNYFYIKDIDTRLKKVKDNFDEYCQNLKSDYYKLNLKVTINNPSCIDNIWQPNDNIVFVVVKYPKYDNIHYILYYSSSSKLNVNNFRNKDYLSKIKWHLKDTY